MLGDLPKMIATHTTQFSPSILDRAPVFTVTRIFYAYWEKDRPTAVPLLFFTWTTVLYFSLFSKDDARPLAHRSSVHVHPPLTHPICFCSHHAQQLSVNMAFCFLQSVSLFQHEPFSLILAQNFEINRCHGSEIRKRNIKAEIKAGL